MSKKLAFVVSMALLTPACQAKVESITITPSPVKLTTDAKTALVQGAAKSAAGEVIEGVMVTWSSSDPAVAKVDASGSVEAVSSGKAKIVAKAGEVSAEAEVMVDLVTSAAVAPAAATLEVGQTAPMAFKLVNDKGEARAAEGAVTWSTSDAAIATVSATGEVTAVAAGEVKVEGAQGELTAQATVTVTAPAVVEGEGAPVAQ
jgi:uncharacterized protein YjdB